MVGLGFKELVLVNFPHGGGCIQNFDHFGDALVLRKVVVVGPFPAVVAPLSGGEKAQFGQLFRPHKVNNRK